MPSSVPTPSSGDASSAHQDRGALQRIAQLKAEISSLAQSALQECIDRRKAILQELEEVEAALANLKGEKPERSPGLRRAPREEPRNLPLSELKELLAAAPDRTVNIRKENLELRNIKVLAAANPHLLQIGGKPPWPTVTLLK